MAVTVVDPWSRVSSERAARRTSTGRGAQGARTSRHRQVRGRAARRVQPRGTYFEYLLGRFTEPGEIFGSVDLRRLRDGVVEVQTAGMLPEADVAFLDEVFLGSTAILNTMLGVLNERTFRHGRTVRRCPLRVCVGATNTLPTDPALAALADLLGASRSACLPHAAEALSRGIAARAERLAAAASALLQDLDALALDVGLRLRAEGVLREIDATLSTEQLPDSLADLPWCDGAVYLGWQAGALLPTTLAPGVPGDLLLAAVSRRVPPECSLVAVLPGAIVATPPPR